MSLADDQETQRLLDRERELEAARPWWRKAIDWMAYHYAEHELVLDLLLILVAALLVLVFLRWLFR